VLTSVQSKLFCDVSHSIGTPCTIPVVGAGLKSAVINAKEMIVSFQK